MWSMPATLPPSTTCSPTSSSSASSWLSCFVVGYRGWRKQRGWFVTQPWAFVGPLFGATALWVISVYVFWKHRGWFYDNAHNWSANTLFIFFGIAVIIIGKNKWFGSEQYFETASKGWAATYWGIAALMLVGGLVIFFAGKGDEHRTFVLEAYEIAVARCLLAPADLGPPT